MSKRNLARNTTLLVSSAVSAVWSDPLDYLSKVTQRLPRSIVRILRMFLNLGRPGACRSAYVFWLDGHVSEAQEFLERTEPSQRHRFFNELAVHLRASHLIDTDELSPRLKKLIRQHAGDSIQDFPVALPSQPLNEVSSKDLSVFHLLTNSAPHSHGGYAYRSHKLLRAQQRAGARVAAATRLGYPVVLGKGGARRTDRVDGIVYHRLLPWKLKATPAAQVRQAADLLTPLVKEFGADVISTTTDFTNALVASVVAQRLQIPWTYEFRGLPEDTWVASFKSDGERLEAGTSPRYEQHQRMEISAAKAAAHVFALGPALASDLESRGVNPKAITTLRNAVNPEAQFAQGDMAALRRKLGIPRAELWVGSITSLVPYEGLDLLLKAVSAARLEGVDVRALIVGDGVSRPSLEKTAKELGLRHGQEVIFTGRLSYGKAATYYGALDVFALPRKDERVCRLVEPLKPLQAVAAGRPIMSSDLPALRNLLEPFKAAIFLPPDDPSTWTRALMQWVRSPSSRQAHEYRGDIMSTEFTWPAQAELSLAATGAKDRDR